MRALLAGGCVQAERFAAEALALGAPGETVTAPQYYASQLLAIRREQGRMAELEQPARELVRSNPLRPAWRAALAALLCETGPHRGGPSRARRVWPAGTFSTSSEDGDWMTAITLLADCCADLGDAERAEHLYELLTPYRDANVVIGLAVVCLGSAARYLGRLAATIGPTREATEHFERALVAEAALKAPVCLAHTQLEYARMLGPESAKGRSLLARRRPRRRNWGWRRCSAAWPSWAEGRRSPRRPSAACGERYPPAAYVQDPRHRREAFCGP